MVFLILLGLGSCKKNESSAIAETVLKPLTFDPANGQVGDLITLYGSFTSEKSLITVKFRDKVAVIKTATDNKLEVFVPSNSITGSITVTINGKSVESLTDFRILYPEMPKKL